MFVPSERTFPQQGPHHKLLIPLPLLDSWLPCDRAALGIINPLSDLHCRPWAWLAGSTHTGAYHFVGDLSLERLYQLPGLPTCHGMKSLSLVYPCPHTGSPNQPVSFRPETVPVGEGRATGPAWPLCIRLGYRGGC